MTMRKKVAIKAAPRRGHANQRFGVGELRKRLNGPLLDLDRSEAYLIDPYADRYAKDFPGDRRMFLRSEVERLARIAVERTSHDIKRAPEAREKARDMLRSVTEIASKARWLISNRFDLIEVASGLRLKDTAGPYVSATIPLSQIIGGLKAVCEWQRELKGKFEIKSPPSHSRTEVLAQHFLRLMAEFHQLRTGKPTPKSRGGPFIYFVQNAWADLNFPDLPERTLASLAERYRN